MSLLCQEHFLVTFVFYDVRQQNGAVVLYLCH